MMGPDSAFLGIADEYAKYRYGGIGGLFDSGGFFDNLLTTGVDLLQKKAAAYTMPKAPAQYAVPPAAPVIVKAAAPAVAVPAEAGIPTWVWVAGGVGGVALLGGLAVLMLGRRR
jgi:hypothetical protein